MGAGPRRGGGAGRLWAMASAVSYVEAPTPSFLFDLDGTLIDSVYQHVIAWRYALSDLGIDLSVWRIHRRIGMSGGLFVSALLRETGLSLSQADIDRLQQAHAEQYRAQMDSVTALPGALAGIVWMLFFTGTTLNVPSLMGAIMCIGVATSNSILLVNFAAGEMKDGKNSFEAAVGAGFTRLRPVLMTALAMIVGMIPMSLGIGEGAEQNAPLGRAVIGGLLIATVATLFFVPVVYSFVRRKGYTELFAE